MDDTRFKEIMKQWDDGLNQTMELFTEGQKKLIHASESFFDGLHFVSQLFGNQQLSEIYDAISKHFNEIGKDMTDKEKKTK